MQQNITDFQIPHLTYSSPQMARRLIADLQASAERLDFQVMLNSAALLAKFAKHSINTQALLAALITMAEEDALASLLAIEVIAEIPQLEASKVLLDYLSHADPSVRRQATWKLAQRPPILEALPGLFNQLCVGGMDTMHAHQTLSHWAHFQPALITRLLIEALAVNASLAERVRLVDLLGVLHTTKANTALANIATDQQEALPVRLAAISAMGSHKGKFVGLLSQLLKDDTAIGVYARLALFDHQSSYKKASSAGANQLRICQMSLANVDSTLSAGGCGDTGGVASLLVSLGQSLVKQPEIDQVLTLGLGDGDKALASLQQEDKQPLTYAAINVGYESLPVNGASAWEHLPTIKRGIRRALGNFGGVDVLHLRMLDVATLAAAEVAHSLSIPVCFSFAPDPHNVLHSLQSSEQLDRQAFMDVEATQNLWYRGRMLERMVKQAKQLAVFPQPRSQSILNSLSPSPATQDQPVMTIAEGIDLALVDKVKAIYQNSQQLNKHTIIQDLQHRINPSRRHLPILLSVGRMHPGKGMARIVEAWAKDSDLYNTCNLVIAGGDITNPTAIEKAVMAEIDGLVSLDDDRRSGLILLGGRPRADIALLMVAAVEGLPGYWAEGGIYVDGALKEEFGLALLEALASGLVVVAPSTGGPPTYVAHGDTGILVAPEDDLGQAIHHGFNLVMRPDRKSRALHMVEEHYTIGNMAKNLTKLYLHGRNNP